MLNRRLERKTNRSFQKEERIALTASEIKVLQDPELELLFPRLCCEGTSRGGPVFGLVGVDIGFELWSARVRVEER